MSEPVAINNIFKLENKKTSTWLAKNLENTSKLNNIKEIFNFSDKIYQKGYSSLDIMNYISNSKKIDGLEKYKLLIFFDKARIEFRNEKILIFYILTIVLLRIKCDLENICEM